MKGWITENYKIINKIAGNKDSEVYLCRAFNLEIDTVAVKVFKNAAEDAMVENYFKRECEVLSLLRHENIVNIYDEGYDKENKVFFIVLEYIEGKTLEEILRLKSISTYDRESIIIQLLDAVNYAHSQNILHRDIKPGNIMVTADNKVKVIDFGISKILESIRTDGENFTIQSMTLKYASPEQKLNKSLTFQTDIYSLGIVIFEVLKGELCKASSEFKKHVMATAGISVQKKTILKEMLEDNVEDRVTNVYKIQRAWNECKKKSRNGYVIGLTNNAINKLYECGMIKRGERILANAFVLDDLDGDIYFSTAKVAYNDAESKNLLLWGRQVQYICNIDKQSKDSFTIISVNIPETDLLEFKKETCGMLIDGKFYFSLESKNKIDANKITTKFNEIQFKNLNKNDENSNKEIMQRWTDILDIQKEMLENNKNTLRYSNLRYDEKDGRIYIKIKNNINDVEFTQDQMLVLNITEGNGFKSKRAGYFNDFKNGFLSIDLIRGLSYTMFSNSGEVAIDTAYMDSLISKQENALKKVKNNECINRNLAKIIANPSEAKRNYNIKEIEFNNKMLDDNKKELIENALSAKDLFLLQGPPGTGKTTFISELVAQQLKLNSNSKILIASQSNVAVNHAMNKLKENSEEIKVVRLGRNEMITNGMEYYTIEAQANDVRERIKERTDKYFEHIKSRSFDKELFEKYSILKEVIDFGKDIEKLSKEISKDKEFLEHKIEYLNGKKVIFKKLEELKNQFSSLCINNTNSNVYNFIDEYINLGDEFIKQFDILSKLQDELDQIKIVIEKKEDKLIELQNDRNAGNELLGITESNLEQIKREIEVKVESHKKKFESFSRFERIKNEWLKKISYSEEIEKILIEEVSVIGATCIGIANYSGNFNLKFDLVIVDEAGRATPPELLVPMVLGKKVVLVGDHKQLPPVVDKVLADEVKVKFNYNRNDVEEGLFSYLEKELTDECKGILREQYRMNPVIGDLISNIFYNDKIISRVTREQRQHNIDMFRNNDIVWLDTRNNFDKYEESVGTTKQNTLEATKIVKLLQDIDQQYKIKALNKEIAIISGYKAQKKLITRMIEKQNIKFSNITVEIDTVDAFQGRETDIVIYSIVRSNDEGNIGFLSDQRRLNVSLSRARELLIIIGDSDCVRKNERNPFVRVYDYIFENEYCGIEVL